MRVGALVFAEVTWKHRGIRDAQTLDAMDAQLRIDHGVRGSPAMRQVPTGDTRARARAKIGDHVRRLHGVEIGRQGSRTSCRIARVRASACSSVAPCTTSATSLSVDM